MASEYGYSTSVEGTKAMQAKGVQVYTRLIAPQDLLSNIMSHPPDVDIVVLEDDLAPNIVSAVRSFLANRKTKLMLVSELPEPKSNESQKENGEQKSPN